jgi:hypothetical protein
VPTKSPATFGKELKLRADTLPLVSGGYHETIRKLIHEEFFDRPVSSEAVARRITEKSGNRFSTSHVQTYLKKFLAADILHAVKPSGSKQNFWVLASVTRAEALALLGKSKKLIELQQDLFSPELTRKLQKDFGREIEELRDNFGKHGNCTAFLLRKILEKLLIIVFAKNAKEHLLEDAQRPGGWKGLKEMIGIAAREKSGGVPFLTNKTADEMKGVKFLGDTAAHNPKVSVAMSTIIPQMPYMITAYEELAALL